MATIKVKILTNARTKRNRERHLYYNCSGITSESKICNITAWNEEQKTNLNEGNDISITNCYISQRDTKTSSLDVRNLSSEPNGDVSSGDAVPSLSPLTLLQPRAQTVSLVGILSSVNWHLLMLWSAVRCRLEKEVCH